MTTENITVTITNETAQVLCPYNQQVISTLKNLGGRWDRADRTWNVPLRAEAEARAALVAAFGTDGSSETAAVVVTVEVTARELIIGDLDAVTFCGVTLARATGRDSGAEVGPAASLISGEITSGGSRANWETQVKEGATFRVEMPRAALDLAVGEMWSYRIITSTDDQRDALTARREALLDELAKIDANLAELDHA